ncbi:MAG: PAS domain S-box protein [Anaerolineales bacterium]|nr:MAG: PAS domain S-box protein [Anaerolineales bacterium]
MVRCPESILNTPCFHYNKDVGNLLALILFGGQEPGMKYQSGFIYPTMKGRLPQLVWKPPSSPNRQQPALAGFLPLFFLSGSSDRFDIFSAIEPQASPWLTIGFSVTAGIIIIFVIYILLLRRLVRIKTESLQESEEKYRRFFMTSNEPVFITSKDGKWLDANQATIRLFGYETKKELFNTPVSHAYKNPEERPDLLLNVERSGFIKDLPVDMVDKDGNILHTMLTTTAIKSSDGEVIGFQGTIRDNTNWIATQKRIEESRESLDLAITGTGAGLWDWNIPNNTININDRFADMIGFEKSELIPLNIEGWEKLSHTDDLENSNKLLLKHFAGDLYHYQAEIRMKHKNGQWVWVLNQGRVVERNADRSPLRMVGTTQDITERIQIRESIQTYADQLEALHEVTKSLSSTLSLHELLNLILVKLEQTLAFDSASIFLYENEELRIETVHNHPHPELVVGKTFPTNNPLFQEMFSKKKPIIIDNAMRDSRFQGWGEMHHVKGWMGVPLIIQDTFIGYITIDSRKQSAFGSPEVKLANLFASQAAQAIQNARLYERVTQYAETLETRIEKRTKELSKMVDFMAGREIRMSELKQVIDQLQAQLRDHNLKPVAQDPLKNMD